MDQLTPSRAATPRALSTPLGPLALLAAGSVDNQHPPLLLVPGYTGSKEDFAPLLDPLADAGFHVVAFDQRGQFESPGPDNSEAYFTQALAKDLLLIADDLGTPVHVVGHSFGGLVARAAVIASPESAASLTLLCSGPAAIGNNIRRDRLEAVAPLLATGGMEAVYDALEAIEPTPKVSPELRAFLRRRFVASSPIGLQVMGRAVAAEEPDLVDELRATEVPVMVACGEQDDAWSLSIQADMAQRLGVNLVVIRQAGHHPALDNPNELINVLVDFWKNVEHTST